MISDLPKWWQFILWVASSAVAVYTSAYWQLTQLRRMQEDKQPDYYKNSNAEFHRETWRLAHFYTILSALILLCFKPGSDFNILLAIYIGYSMPSSLEKGANWFRKIIENVQKESTIKQVS